MMLMLMMIVGIVGIAVGMLMLMMMTTTTSGDHGDHGDDVGIVGIVGMVGIPMVDGAGVSGYAGMCASRALAVPPSHPLISTLVCIVSHYNVKCITYIICIARATAQLPRMISTIVHTQHCVKCPPMY